jgi:D-amino-acid dehydrogenase
MSGSARDVLVIGGGVVGLSVAYYASLAGADVTLLERNEIGSGSSSGNAGLVVPSFFEPLPSPGVVCDALGQILEPEGFFGIRARFDPSLFSWLLRFARFSNRRHFHRAIDLFLRLNAEGLREHLEMAAVGGKQYEFVQKGLLFLFRSWERFDRAAEKAGRALRAGIPSQVLSGNEVRDLEPGASEKVVGGFRYYTDAVLHPALFVQYLKRQAEARGANISEQTEVYGFRVSRGRVSAALTTKGDKKADQIVLAAGVWIRGMGRWLGVNLPLEGGKGISLTFVKPNVNVLQPLILDEHVAVSPFLSALRVTGVLELAGFDMTLSPARVRGLQRTAARYLPALKDLRPGQVWRGLRPCLPDGLPFLGRLHPYANVIVAGGHDTRGISLGLVTGRYVARLLNGESLHDMETMLSPNRF